MSEVLERKLGRLLTVGTRVSTAVLTLGLGATFVVPRSRVTHQPRLKHAP